MNDQGHKLPGSCSRMQEAGCILWYLVCIQLIPSYSRVQGADECG